MTMLHKIFLGLTIAVFASAILSGCEKHYSSASKVLNDIYPKITEYGDSTFSGYYYAVDERTGVVYIVYNGYRRKAMAPALNADGTPITADQLELK